MRSSSSTERTPLLNLTQNLICSMMGWPCLSHRTPKTRGKKTVRLSVRNPVRSVAIVQTSKTYCTNPNAPELEPNFPQKDKKKTFTDGPNLRTHPRTMLERNRPPRTCSLTCPFVCRAVHIEHHCVPSPSAKHSIAANFFGCAAGCDDHWPRVRR